MSEFIAIVAVPRMNVQPRTCSTHPTPSALPLEPAMNGPPCLLSLNACLYQREQPHLDGPPRDYPVSELPLQHLTRGP